MRTDVPVRPTILPYRKPTEGRDYWLLDDALPDAAAVRARSLTRTDWSEGYPYKPEAWPGMRALPALEPDELAHVEAWEREVTGSKRRWVEATPDGAKHNNS
jgi:hypothetical protein